MLLQVASNLLYTIKGIYGLMCLKGQSVGGLQVRPRQGLNASCWSCPAVPPARSPHHDQHDPDCLVPASHRPEQKPVPSLPAEVGGFPLMGWN